MGQKIALLVGNSDYQDTALARLAKPIADVNGLAAVLQDARIGAFDRVTPLINRSAADVRLEIESFFADKKPDDLLLLYFAGHGVRDDQGLLFLAVNDTRHNRLRATAVPAAFVTGEMDRSRSRRQVLILDCCHSGSFAQGTRGVTGESVGTKAAFEGIGYGRVVLTATDATQYAWEGDEVIGEAENSVFTHHLLQGLRTGEADTDNDGDITLDELYDYVYEKVVSATPRQTPSKWSYRQQGEFVIAHNPNPHRKVVPLPAELQQAVESPFSGVREGAVRELGRLLHGQNQGLALSAQNALKHLAEDDSRRVAAAAAAALQLSAEASTQQEVPLQIEAPTQAASLAGTPLAAERDVLPRPSSPILRSVGAAADQAVRRNEPLSEASQTPLADGTSTLRELGRTLLGRGVWKPVILTGIGWGLAFLLYVVVSSKGLTTYYSVSTDLDLLGILQWLKSDAHFSAGTHSLKWALVGAIAGAALGLALRWRDTTLPASAIGKLAAAWCIAFAIVLGFGLSIIAPTMADLLDSRTWFIFNVVTGLVGGLLSALTLRSKYPALQGAGAWIVAAGWGMASLVGWLLVEVVLSGRGHILYEAFLLLGFVGGLSIGAIGSAVMYWQLGLQRGSP